MSKSGEKKDARALQRYTGARYSTCLRWALTIRKEGLDKVEYDAGCNDREKIMRIALHKRFPKVTTKRDAGQL